MIGIVTTLATATCANCHGGIRQTKSDLFAVTEWVHEEGGRVTCPGTPVAEPVLKTITREPGIKVVECRWEMQVNGNTRDWVAICTECGAIITRVWNGPDNQPPRGEVPVHLHAVHHPRED